MPTTVLCCRPCVRCGSASPTREVAGVVVEVATTTCTRWVLRERPSDSLRSEPPKVLYQRKGFWSNGPKTAYAQNPPWCQESRAPWTLPGTSAPFPYFL
eukprot:2893755-Pleurochrysis_carterae.AAC.1